MGKHRFRILDTNVLVNHWRCLPPSKRNEAEVTKWARRLIEAYNTNLIASPVRIEFLCGVRSSEELRLSLAYLEPFEPVDQRQIPRHDWEEAERVSKRVPLTGRPRKLGDCLLKAISLRLNCDIVSGDADFERRVPTRRRTRADCTFYTRGDQGFALLGEARGAFPTRSAWMCLALGSGGVDCTALNRWLRGAVRRPHRFVQSNYTCLGSEWNYCACRVRRVLRASAHEFRSDHQ